MQTLENIKLRIQEAVSGARVDVIPNGSPSGQESILIDNAHALDVARFLRDAPEFRFDQATSVTGIDWLDAVEKHPRRIKQVVDGVEREMEEIIERQRPGFLEVVYHLYSIELKHGPLIVRLRTADRGEGAVVPSLTPVWRGAEFQEREVFDLYGVRFEGHPDLRRIFMWENFIDYPMRKDYVEPDDYEYEPTPHDDVLAKTRRHHGVEVKK